jgi:hypothetical protein
VPPYVSREHSARIHSTHTPTLTDLSEGRGPGSDVNCGSVSIGHIAIPDETDFHRTAYSTHGGPYGDQDGWQ